MQFLTPLFLAGLAAIAVPLWFHLIRKEQATRIPFSSLMYVPPREMELVRRQRLRQWPLFLLRSMLIALLVLALSRPYWRSFSATWSSSSLARVVLLDNSLSMRAAGRWNAAREMAEREIRSAPPGSELTLALVSDRVEILSQPGEAPASLIAKVRQVEPTYRATRLDQGIRVAGNLLKQSRQGSREIVLVSDFQKSGLHLASWSLPEGVALRPLALAEAGNNLFIEDVQVPAPAREGAAQQGDIVVRVQNLAPLTVEAPVQLRAGERVLETRQASVAAGGATSVRFQTPDLKDEAILRLAAHLEVADDLAEDNSFFFSMRRQQKIAVILAGGGAARLFLSEAIHAPGGIWQLQPEAGSEALKKARVLILHDPADIPSYVDSWVRQGGGLLVFSGVRAGESLRSPLLPVIPEGNRILRREREEAARLADIEWQHPIFEIFADQQKRYFSTIQFYGHTVARASADARVLARFDRGDPALVEKSAGKGRVLWFATTVSNEWNDLAVRPSFLPLMQQVLSYLAGVGNQQMVFRVGERLDLTPWGGGDVVAIDPRGRRLSIPEDPPVLDFERPGFYELRYSRLTDYTAVNAPASESNLLAEAPRLIQARASGTRVSAAEVSAAMLERQQSWWKLLLLLAALAALGEWLLADLYYGSARGSPESPSRTAAR
ncbi:MAG: BatA domain-containing protein [Acidobacteria bacterium]|nr:BatA domain-containing protein [Acidobacteriota bacterium]